MENRPLFLFGNGLSIALSPEFSLKTITNKFISELKNEEKEFFYELCGGQGNISFDDFEHNFSMLEDAYNSVVKYRRFIESNTGAVFLKRFSLKDPQLGDHEAIIKSLYNKYIFQILTLIRGNVTKQDIIDKLSGFTAFLKKELEAGSKAFVFTLNYDLLAETILLEDIGTENFTDFCSSTSNLKGTAIPKYDFDPALNENKYGEDYSASSIELHHLHGSLSLFYDFERNKAIKLRNEDIFQHDIYSRINSGEWALAPAIITGGGKSLKMNEYPFEFYFRNLKDYSTYAKYNKLYIIGYSFRDDHINDLIKRWLLAVNNYTEALLIVDYQTTEEGKEVFKKIVRKAINKRPQIPDTCFEFGGANSIRSVNGSAAKDK